MNPFFQLGIGLSLLFGFILLGIIADLYYFHWKKRITTPHHEKSKFSSSPASFWFRFQFRFHGQELQKPELTKLQSSLFTIIEETKEDLESNDGKLPRNGSRTSEFTFTPLSSPPVKPGIDTADLVRSSPPPTFKFMKDAEDKLLRKLVAQEAEMQRKFKKQSCQVIPITSCGCSSGGHG